MNKISLAAAAFASLALAACDRGKQEQLGNDVELNAAERPSDDLNALSDQAARGRRRGGGAARTRPPSSSRKAIARTDATRRPETPADENIQGM